VKHPARLRLTFAAPRYLRGSVFARAHCLTALLGSLLQWGGICSQSRLSTYVLVEAVPADVRHASRRRPRKGEVEWQKLGLVMDVTMLTTPDMMASFHKHDTRCRAIVQRLRHLGVSFLVELNLSSGRHVSVATYASREASTCIRLGGLRSRRWMLALTLSL
jgi:hypothetical protein